MSTSTSTSGAQKPDLDRTSSPAMSEPSSASSRPSAKMPNGISHAVSGVTVYEGPDQIHDVKGAFTPPPPPSLPLPVCATSNCI